MSLIIDSVFVFNPFDDLKVSIFLPLSLSLVSEVFDSML